MFEGKVTRGVAGVRQMFGLSIVIPVHNNWSTLENFISFFKQAQPDLQYSLKSLGYSESIECIVVDDGSRTRERENLVQSEARNGCRIRLFRLTRNFGQHAALKCGISEAQGALVLRVNADHGPLLRLLPDMMQALVSSKFDRVVPLTRNREPFISRFWVRVERGLLGLDVSSGAIPMTLWSRNFVDKMSHDTASWVYIREIEDWIGCTTFYFSHPEIDNPRVSSTYSVRRRLGLMFQIVASRPARLLRIMLTASMLIFSFMIALSAILGALAILGVYGGNGTVTIVMIQTLIFFCLSTMLLGVGLLVVRATVEASGRPPYQIRERMDCD